MDVGLVNTIVTLVWSTEIKEVEDLIVSLSVQLIYQALLTPSVRVIFEVMVERVPFCTVSFLPAAAPSMKSSQMNVDSLWLEALKGKSGVASFVHVRSTGDSCVYVVIVDPTKYAIKTTNINRNKVLFNLSTPFYDRWNRNCLVYKYFGFIVYNHAFLYK